MKTTHPPFGLNKNVIFVGLLMFRKLAAPPLLCTRPTNVNAIRAQLVKLRLPSIANTVGQPNFLALADDGVLTLQRSCARSSTPRREALTAITKV